MADFFYFLKQNVRWKGYATFFLPPKLTPKLFWEEQSKSVYLFHFHIVGKLTKPRIILLLGTWLH